MIQGIDNDSDENLRQASLAVFAADGRAAFAELRVGVLNRVLHLAGKVDSLALRAAAEELARQVSGVRGVVNRIEAPGAPGPSRRINLDLKNSDEEKRTEL